MNDCTNAEIRDQLPDLLHERLDASARAMVLAHVEVCVDCRDELQLLRDVQRMSIARTPRVDIAYVVNALPKPPARKAPVAPRRIWADWRVAAAVTLLVAGGGSYAITNSYLATTPKVANAETSGVKAVATPTQSNAEVPSAPQSQATQAVASNDDAANAGIGGDSRLSDMSEAQLQSLLDDINGFRAVPATEPEPVSLRVNVKVNSTMNDDGAGT